jgi:hypothetical protein
LTESVRSFHVPATPGTSAWPPSLPSVPTSRATRVTSEANPRSWSTIVLMASFSCRISPRTSTVILRDRSPLATAIVTSEMLRTWSVRFDAIEFTLSVRSFHTPLTSFTCAWPPSFPSVPTSRATRVTSEVNTLICSIIVFTMRAERRNSPSRGRPSTSSRIVCERSPFATAAIVRVTSDVGHSRSSIRVLTEVSMPPHAPRWFSQNTRSRIFPRLPTCCPTRFSSAASVALEATISLKTSAIFPFMPVQSFGRRTEKLPSSRTGDLQQVARVQDIVRGLRERQSGRWSAVGGISWFVEHRRPPSTSNDSARSRRPCAPSSRDALRHQALRIGRVHSPFLVPLSVGWKDEVAEERLRSAAVFNDAGKLALAPLWKGKSPANSLMSRSR